jgi:hypothetical protein
MMGVANLVATLVVTASLVTEAVVAQSTADILNQLQANGVNITLLNSTSTITARSQNGCSLLVSPINFGFSRPISCCAEIACSEKTAPMRERV